MMYPEALEVNGTEYAINTGYEFALAAIACIDDPDLGDIERAYGVLEILYEETPEDAAEAVRMAVKYLQLGKEPSPAGSSGRRPDMDYAHDMGYIRSSFRSDYGIDLLRSGLHWWEFIELLQGLSDTCVLNRVRDVRNYDLSTVKDAKTRARMRQAQAELALPNRMAREDEATLDAFYAQLNIPEP